MLCHASGADLVRAGTGSARQPVEAVSVAGSTGRADMSTTRRYALPADAGRAAASEALTVDR
ncbi:site-specific integrase [Nocardiopsis sp. NPDC101807]|uniref:site-specific integrase n=1 Tax=Nocardiopsis sp. NPDC101807 TaxID=3364339 RepID=UPI0038062733